MCPPRTLPYSLIPQSDSGLFQAELVNNLLLLPHFQTFPPARDFRRQFWKWVVEGLETRDEEVDERIYEAYLELLSVPTSHLVSKPPPPSYNTHFWSPSFTSSSESKTLRLTTLLESRTMIEGGTTGLTTWGASLRLADWIVSHSVQDRRVLELGSGAGFLGLIIAALQMDTVRQIQVAHTPSLVLTDGNSEVLSRCRDNFKLPCNGMGAHPSLDFRLLNWSDALDGEGNIDSRSAVNEILKDADIIVGADLVYDATIVPALVAVLAIFFNIKGETLQHDDYQRTGAYIALTVRRKDTVSKFIDHLTSHSLEHEVFDLDTRSETQFLGRAEVGAQENVKLVRIFRTGSPPQYVGD